MRKLLFFFLFLPFLSNAQNNAELEEDKLVSSIGSKVAETPKVKVGTSSMPYGDFKYIGSASTLSVQFNNWGGYLGLYTPPNAGMRSQSSLEYKISKMRAERRRGMGCINTDYRHCAKP
jgi:hypothetical protein